jgi:RimJ/RimL family protein N-acetyltransferase
LHTARFTLRLWTADDVADLLDLDDDPEVTRFTGRAAQRSQREAIWQAHLSDPQQRPYLCVRDRNSGEFIGWALICPFTDDSGDWEIGYRYRKAWWGKGVGTEVATALMAWAWSQPQIQVVGAVYDPRNVASRAILSKVGMREAPPRLYFDEGPVPYCEVRRGA